MKLLVYDHQMARIKLNLPHQKIFNTSLTVRVTDINYGGHLANQAVLGICHEARLRFLKQHEFSEMDFFGKSLIMSDAAICYKNEAFAGDKLEIDLFADDLNAHGFDLYYQLKTDSKEIARAKTGLVFFDYKKKKIAQAPKTLGPFLSWCKQHHNQAYMP